MEPHRSSREDEEKTDLPMRMVRVEEGDEDMASEDGEYIGGRLSAVVNVEHTRANFVSKKNKCCRNSLVGIAGFLKGSWTELPREFSCVRRVLEFLFCGLRLVSEERYPGQTESEWAQRWIRYQDRYEDWFGRMDENEVHDINDDGAEAQMASHLPLMVFLGTSLGMCYFFLSIVEKSAEGSGGFERMDSNSFVKLLRPAGALIWWQEILKSGLVWLGCQVFVRALIEKTELKNFQASRGRAVMIFENFAFLCLLIVYLGSRILVLIVACIQDPPDLDIMEDLVIYEVSNCYQQICVFTLLAPCLAFSLQPLKTVLCEVIFSAISFCVLLAVGYNLLLDASYSEERTAKMISILGKDLGRFISGCWSLYYVHSLTLQLCILLKRHARDKSEDQVEPDIFMLIDAFWPRRTRCRRITVLAITFTVLVSIPALSDLVDHQVFPATKGYYPDWVEHGPSFTIFSAAMDVLLIPMLFMAFGKSKKERAPSSFQSMTIIFGGAFGFMSYYSDLFPQALPSQDSEFQKYVVWGQARYAVGLVAYGILCLLSSDVCCSRIILPLAEWPCTNVIAALYCCMRVCLWVVDSGSGPRWSKAATPAPAPDDSHRRLWDILSDGIDSLDDAVILGGGGGGGDAAQDGGIEEVMKFINRLSETFVAEALMMMMISWFINILMDLEDDDLESEDGGMITAESLASAATSAGRSSGRQVTFAVEKPSVAADDEDHFVGGADDMTAVLSDQHGFQAARSHQEQHTPRGTPFQQWQAARWKKTIDTQCGDVTGGAVRGTRFFSEDEEDEDIGSTKTTRSRLDPLSHSHAPHLDGERSPRGEHVHTHGHAAPATFQEPLEIIVPHLLDGKLGIRAKQIGSSGLTIVGFDDPRSADFGWKVGDEIAAMKGKPISSREDLRHLFMQHKDELPLVFTVLRRNQEAFLSHAHGHGRRVLQHRDTAALRLLSLVTSARQANAFSASSSGSEAVSQTSTTSKVSRWESLRSKQAHHIIKTMSSNTGLALLVEPGSSSMAPGPSLQPPAGSDACSARSSLQPPGGAAVGVKRYAHPRGSAGHQAQLSPAVDALPSHKRGARPGRGGLMTMHEVPEEEEEEEARTSSGTLLTASVAKRASDELGLADEVKRTDMLFKLLHGGRSQTVSSNQLRRLALFWGIEEAASDDAWREALEATATKAGWDLAHGLSRGQFAHWVKASEEKLVKAEDVASCIGVGDE